MMSLSTTTKQFSPNIARPVPSEEDVRKYDGVAIKNFPKETKKHEVIEFLKSKGLPEDFSNDNIAFGSHGNVEIRKMSSKSCQELISNIHFVTTRQTFFGKPIYCRATRDLTPEKPKANEHEVEKENDEETKQDEAAALFEVTEAVETDEEETDDFVFDSEPLDKIKSKLLEGTDGSSSEEEAPDPALKFLKDPKTPATSKQKKRERTTPSGTSDKKVEKKTKSK